MPQYDIVVVGAGTAGSYAAATAADAGLDVGVLERKSKREAGRKACGDALKGASSLPDSIPTEQIEPSITNTAVDHGRFELPGQAPLEIPVPGELAVVDRFEWGNRLIEAAVDAGADLHYETVVNDVRQASDGRVVGVDGVKDGDPISVDADVVIDASGALSVLQEQIDFSGTTFESTADIRGYTSAYREVLEVEEPVDWSDALVFKMTDRAAGYLWYFPRTPTEINAGVGFQMTEDPMELSDVLRRDLQTRPEFEGATVTNKLGASLPTRRPFDSAVAPGFLAAGDAAGHVNPTTGGGIAGAAYAGTYAAQTAVDALADGEPTEAALWDYNTRVMDHFGARYAALDVYNMLTTAVDPDELTDLLGVLPGERIAESLYSGSTSFDPRLVIETAIKTFGRWELLYKLYKTKERADALMAHYEAYPNRPEDLDAWQRSRDRLTELAYETTGADPKY